MTQPIGKANAADVADAIASLIFLAVDSDSDLHVGNGGDTIVDIDYNDEHPGLDEQIVLRTKSGQTFLLRPVRLRW